MELISIKQVSLDYGISRQMLSYYEEMGLIKSSRANASAYRVYDEDAVKRLQQIIILRKLQIPVKKIGVILNNPEAAAVIEIFKQNISEMEKEISALSTIKLILEKFVSDIEKITAVQMNLDILTDDSVQKMVESLSLVQKNIKESFMSMNELNQASEHLRKQAEKNVTLVHRPPAMMVEIKGNFEDMPQGERRKAVEDMAKKFIKETDLFKKKPDMRFFMLYKKDIVWLTIPDNMEVPPPYKKFEYPGGLYAANTESDFDIWDWYVGECNDNYCWDIERQFGREYFNPFNIHGLDDYDSQKEWACSYNTQLMPIKELKTLLPDADKKRFNAELDKIMPCGEPVDIDLMSMILQTNDERFASMNFPKNNGEICEVNYPNEFLELKYEYEDKSIGMLTLQEFNAPIKIELRAKADKGNLFFGCASIFAGLNYEERNELHIIDGTNNGWYFNIYKKCGVIPVDEFVDIEFFLGRDFLAIRVNGDLRHYSSTYGYIEALKENPEYNLEMLWVGTRRGSTVTVQSLRVTEI